MNNTSNENRPCLPEFLTRRQVADIVLVCPHTIARMEKTGQIKVVKFNRRLIRYPRSEVQRLLQEATV